MEIIFAAIIIIIIAKLIGMIASAIRAKKENKHQHQYKAKKYLCSVAEKNFYHILNSYVGNDFKIFSKVRLEDVLYAENTSDRSHNTTARNKIRSKHIDFLITTKNNLEIVSAIELDDKSHQRKDRIERDEFVNAAFESAGIPLIRFKCQKSYQPEEFKAKLDGILNK